MGKALLIRQLPGEFMANPGLTLVFGSASLF